MPVLEKLFMDITAEVVKSDRLKWYLVIFRIMALLIGLMLTGGNTPGVFVSWLPISSLFGGSVAENPQPLYMVTFLLIAYNLIAAFWGFKLSESRAQSIMLVIADSVAGFFTCMCLGSCYLLLGLVLPVLEASFLLGSRQFFIALAILGLFFIVILAGELVVIYGKPALAGGEETEAAVTYHDLLKRLFFQCFQLSLSAAVLFFWSFKVMLHQEEEMVQFQQTVAEEKQLIIEDAQHDKITIQGLSNALTEKEVETEKMRRKLLEVQEELDKNYRQYQDQRNQNLAQSELFKEKERELALVTDKRIKKVEADMAELQRKQLRAQQMVEISMDLNKSLNPQETYVSIVEYVLNLIPVQTCILFMLETVNNHTEIFAEMVYSPYSDFFRNFSVRMGEGIPGWVAEYQKPIKIDDGSITLDGKEINTLLNYEKSALAVPILYEEEILGVLYLGRQEKTGFTAENMELLTQYAGMAAITLQNSQLFQRTVSSGLFDDITAIYNSIYFNERFGEETKRSQRYKTNLSLLLMEVDNFAGITSEYGSDWGDSILREVAEVVKEHTRETDVAARIQAGQFAIILLQSDKNNAIAIAERIRAAFEMRNVSRMRRARISALLSVGVANFPADAQNKDDLISSVEQSLEKSKSRGGNNVCYS